MARLFLNSLFEHFPLFSRGTGSWSFACHLYSFVCWLCEVSAFINMKGLAKQSSVFANKIYFINMKGVVVCLLTIEIFTVNISNLWRTPLKRGVLFSQIISEILKQKWHIKELRNRVRCSLAKSLLQYHQSLWRIGYIKLNSLLFFLNTKIAKRKNLEVFK